MKPLTFYILVTPCFAREYAKPLASLLRSTKYKLEVEERACVKQGERVQHGESSPAKMVGCTASEDPMQIHHATQLPKMPTISFIQRLNHMPSYYKLLRF